METGGYNRNLDVTFIVALVVNNYNCTYVQSFHGKGRSPKELFLGESLADADHGEWNQMTKSRT